MSGGGAGIEFVSPHDLHSLLNGFRAILEGTASPSTPAVPASLAGYFLIVGDAGVRRRPLGETHHLIWKELNRAELAPVHRDLVSLYYGIDLQVMALTSTSPDEVTIASSFPPMAQTTGRPSAASSGSLGLNAARHQRTIALSELAKRWRPLAAESVFQPVGERNPLSAPWFTTWSSQAEPNFVRYLLLDALSRARGLCGPTASRRALQWAELDDWSYRAFSSGSLAPLRRVERITAKRRLRGNALVSICLWGSMRDVRNGTTSWPVFSPPATSTSAGAVGLATDGVEAATAFPLGRQYLLPRPEHASLLLFGDERELAVNLIEELTSQMTRGFTSLDAAIMLAWIGPKAVLRLDSSWVSKGAAAISRASADHREFDSVGIDWLRRAIDLGGPQDYIAEAALNMSVALAVRRRYSEAEWVIDFASRKVDFDDSSKVKVFIGRSAWRRRLLNDALAQGGSHPPNPRLIDLARETRRFALGATELLKDGSPLPGDVLRAEVRLSESLSIGYGLLARLGNTSSALARLVDEANRVRDRSLQALSCSDTASFYDLARISVISEVAEALGAGVWMSDFSILKRVRALEVGRST